MTLKLLTEHHLEFLSLKGGCTGSSESTLVKIPHCWKSRATAHIVLITSIENILSKENLRLYVSPISTRCSNGQSVVEYCLKMVCLRRKKRVAVVADVCCVNTLDGF